jgi:protein CpxP
MKKLVLSLVLVAGLAFAANAQQGGGQGGQRRPQMTPEERVKQLDEKVKLTDEQKTKATAVYAEAVEAQKKMREEMQAGGGDRQAMMEKMQKMTADTDTKLNAIFTADQKTAYKTWQDQVKADREKMMKERQAGGGGK